MEAESVVQLASGGPEATEDLAARLGGVLEDGDVVALVGELGSGKTCFVRGLARGLGVETPIQSPTYTLHQEHEGRTRLHHLDAWMEGRERAFLLDGGAEWITGDGVAAIEWADRVADLLPDVHLRVELVPRGADDRRVTLTVVGDGPAAIDLRRRVASALDSGDGGGA